MIDPITALLTVVGAAALLVVLFWPVHGLFWRLLSMMRATGRVQTEDALKHLYDCEYHKHPCTLQSISGALGLSGNRAVRLLAQLEQLGLARAEAGRYLLTADGRGYALRVIRIHRLWEKYLADETGLDASEWHAKAEIQEHRTTPEEAEALAARMGFPRYDPHGDPIPTASGEIAPPRGCPVTDLAAGSSAEVVHVEDEPAAVYAQLVAEGLQQGSRIRVLESTPQRIRLESDGDEHLLAPVVAANLSVVELAEEELPAGTVERLSSLSLGESATVTGISAACRGPERRRMLDLGLVPGTVVAAEMKSPAGDPTAYRVRGAMIALRRSQAELIHVERATEEGAA
jgi:DtxR family Mn-dependent transcriptional regulator